MPLGTSKAITTSVSSRQGTRLGVTVVIPAYNEEKGIVPQIEAVRNVLAGAACDFEIIVVDDGSEDGTADLAESQPVTVERVGVNRGYGAALKRGVQLAKFDWVLIIDADGTYPCEDIPRMLERAGSSDMAVGARIGRHVQHPWMRTLPKWFLRKLASYLVNEDIPDLNSGLRLMRKTAVEEFAHILPSGFSFTTTITLAMMSRGYAVSYIPIDYFKRVGKSKINATHAVQFAFMIVRTMMLFKPMRVLGPIAAFLFIVGVAKLIYDLETQQRVGSELVMMGQGVMVWAMALFADQNVRFHQGKR